MKNSNEKYLDEKMAELIRECLEAEREWLVSINAPVTSVPDDVAIPIMARMLFSTMPPEVTRQFVEYVLSSEILGEALGTDGFE